jgi:hypothetical protein
MHRKEDFVAATVTKKNSEQAQHHQIVCDAELEVGGKTKGSKQQRAVERTHWTFARPTVA